MARRKSVYELDATGNNFILQSISMSISLRPVGGIIEGDGRIRLAVRQ